MIIRKVTAEFGCAEAGRQFEGQNGTKLLQERGLKMPKMMKDMFNQLCKTFDQDRNPKDQLSFVVAQKYLFIACLMISHNH